MLKKGSASSRYHVYQFSDKTDNFDFFGPNLPQMDFSFEIQKTTVGIRISFDDIPCVPIFRQNGQLWLFWPKFAQKTIFGLEIQKINVGKKISILKIPCVPIFRQNEQLWLFWPKFAQKWILRSEFQKTNVGIRMRILEIPCVPIFRQTNNFVFLGPNMPKN